MRINKKELLQIVTENAYFAKRADLEKKDVEAKKESFNKWVEVAEARKRISAEELQEAINLGFKTAEDEAKQNNVKIEEARQPEEHDVEKKELLEIIARTSFRLHSSICKREYKESETNDFYEWLAEANKNNIISEEEIQEAVDIGIKNANCFKKETGEAIKELRKKIIAFTIIANAIHAEGEKENWQDDLLLEKRKKAFRELNKLIGRFNRLTSCGAQVRVSVNGFEVIDLPEE